MVKSYLNLIDTRTAGRRYDVTPLFTSRTGFRALIDDLAAPFEDKDLSHVAGIDTLGFVLAGGLARRLRTGMIPVRNGTKLPLDRDSVDRVDFVDCAGLAKALELRLRGDLSGAKALLVDDWIETGAQICAASRLLENQSITITGIAAIAIDDNERTRELRMKYRCHAVWTGSVSH